jgi:hypothetical protein
MCNGIAVLVFEENGRLKGLCNGTKHHDELCRENENLRLGKIEPYRFELYYPCNIVYDRGANSLPLAEGLMGEQPPREVWDVAFSVAEPFFMKHGLDQLEYANLMGSNLIGSNLSGSNLMGSNLIGSNLSGSNLMGSNLIGSNLSGSNLRGANLIGSNLSGSNLSGANLICSNLSGSNLSGANLSGSNLRNIITNKYTILPPNIKIKEGRV